MVTRFEKPSWTGSRTTEVHPDLQRAVGYLTRQHQIEAGLRQHLPTALARLAEHKRGQRTDGMIVRNRSAWAALDRCQDALKRLRAMAPDYPDLAAVARQIDEYDGLQTQVDDLHASGGDPVRLRQIQAKIDAWVSAQITRLQRAIAYVETQGRAIVSGDLITRGRQLEWRGSEPGLFGPAVRRGW